MSLSLIKYPSGGGGGDSLRFGVSGEDFEANEQRLFYLNDENDFTIADNEDFLNYFYYSQFYWEIYNQNSLGTTKNFYSDFDGIDSVYQRLQIESLENERDQFLITYDGNFTGSAAPKIPPMVTSRNADQVLFYNPLPELFLFSSGTAHEKVGEGSTESLTSGYGANASEAFLKSTNGRHIASVSTTPYHNELSGGLVISPNQLTFARTYPDTYIGIEKYDAYHELYSTKGENLTAPYKARMPLSTDCPVGSVFIIKNIDPVEYFDIEAAIGDTVTFDSTAMGVTLEPDACVTLRLSLTNGVLSWRVISEFLTVTLM